MSAVDYVIDAVDEPLHFGRRRRREDPEMDITPMIDITFLLLIFFLVATRLSNEGVVDLPRAKHGTAVAADSAVVITVTSGIGDEAFIFKGDGAFPETRLTSNDLAAQQEELETYIAEQ